MIITDCLLQQYDLPLSCSLIVGTSSITTRKGVILTLQTDAGLAGHGEIAPLPGLHQETFSDALKQILACQAQLTAIPISQDMLSFDGKLSQVLPLDLFPSARLGVEMAILDILLQLNSDLTSFPGSIPINALLAAEDEEIPNQVDKLLSEGFASIKIKIARGRLEDDIKIINDVKSRVQGRALLRLDANRGWTLDQAKRFCEAVGPQGIEYIEEPTKDPADHVHLDFPIALDETLSEQSYDQLYPEHYHAIVLKPVVLGSFEKTAELIRRAKKNNILTVISSAFETGLTMRMYLYFAALMGITQTPLGLDTGKYFLQELLSAPLTIEGAKISLPPLDIRPVLRGELLSSVGDK